MELNSEFWAKAQKLMKPGQFSQYGILGMKWGVRRTEAQLASAAKRAGRSREPSGQDAEVGKRRKKGTNQPTAGTGRQAGRVEAGERTNARGVLRDNNDNSLRGYTTGGSKSQQRGVASMMTDAELNEVINRIQKEQRFAELTSTAPKQLPPSLLQKGQREITKILANSARSLAQEAATHAGRKIIDKNFPGVLPEKGKKKKGS